jgi:hypothetical protein
LLASFDFSTGLLCLALRFVAQPERRLSALGGGRSPLGVLAHNRIVQDRGAHGPQLRLHSIERESRCRLGTDPIARQQSDCAVQRHADQPQITVDCGSRYLSHVHWSSVGSTAFALASASGLLLQPDFLLRSGEALALGVLLSALCDRYLRLSFMLGIGLLVPRLGLRPLLRVPAVALNLILALLVRDLVLRRLALEFGLVFLCGRAGFVRALLRFVRVAGGVGLSLGLRPL